MKNLLCFYVKEWNVFREINSCVYVSPGSLVMHLMSPNTYRNGSQKWPIMLSFLLLRVQYKGAPSGCSSNGIKRGCFAFLCFLTNYNNFVCITCILSYQFLYTVFQQNSLHVWRISTKSVGKQLLNTSPCLQWWNMQGEEVREQVNWKMLKAMKIPSEIILWKEIWQGG